MPEQVEFLPRASLLTFEEIERFVRVAVPLGIDKVRLTGGEPLVRRDLPILIEKLAAIPGIKDIGLTTNGILLAPSPEALRDAGLERINISLDTMDPAKFERADAADRLRAGDRGDPGRQGGRLRPGEGQRRRDPGRDRGRRRAAGPVRPRAWAGAAVHRVHAARRRATSWEREKVLFAAEILEILTREVGPLAPAPNQDPRARPSTTNIGDGGGRVGFIASVSRPFCMSCNRLRLTADGQAPQLPVLARGDRRPRLLRGGASDAEIARAIRESVASKWEGHEINTARFIKPERLMHSIGG